MSFSYDILKSFSYWISLAFLAILLTLSYEFPQHILHIFSTYFQIPSTYAQRVLNIFRTHPWPNPNFYTYSQHILDIFLICSWRIPDKVLSYYAHSLDIFLTCSFTYSQHSLNISTTCSKTCSQHILQLLLAYSWPIRNIVCTCSWNILNISYTFST